jgi:hypothetical protein
MDQHHRHEGLEPDLQDRVPAGMEGGGDKNDEKDAECDDSPRADDATWSLSRRSPARIQFASKETGFAMRVADSTLAFCACGISFSRAIARIRAPASANLKDLPS